LCLLCLDCGGETVGEMSPGGGGGEKSPSGGMGLRWLVGFAGGGVHKSTTGRVNTYEYSSRVREGGREVRWIGLDWIG